MLYLVYMAYEGGSEAIVIFPGAPIVCFVAFQECHHLSADHEEKKTWHTVKDFARPSRVPRAVVRVPSV